MPWPATIARPPFRGDGLLPRSGDARLGSNLEPIRSQAVSLNLSIKNAPDHVVRRLKARAQRNHRSLQGELLAIVEAAVEARHPLTPAEVSAEVGRLKLRTPAESARIVRRDRNGR
ncbi:MAG: Arc family DNA-binding protein [Alphaproteobacteria bacterium]|nr:Arc family DNA-binding protein [Alphaproteobacteria bacterium]